MSPTLRKLRRYFFTGLIVIAPVGVTIVILVWMFRTIDDILGEPIAAVVERGTVPVPADRAHLHGHEPDRPVGHWRATPPLSAHRAHPVSDGRPLGRGVRDQ